MTIRESKDETQESSTQTKLQCYPFIIDEYELANVQTDQAVQTLVTVDPRELNVDIYDRLTHTTDADLLRSYTSVIIIPKKGKIPKLQFLIPSKQTLLSRESSVVVNTQIKEEVNDTLNKHEKSDVSFKSASTDNYFDADNKSIKSDQTEDTVSHKSAEVVLAILDMEQKSNDSSKQSADEASNKSVSEQVTSPETLENLLDKSNQTHEAAISSEQSIILEEEKKKGVLKKMPLAGNNYDPELDPELLFPEEPGVPFVLRGQEKACQETQTYLSVKPHLVDNNEESIVVKDLDTQTSVTCLPENSYTDLLPNLKKYHNHAGQSMGSNRKCTQPDMQVVLNLIDKAKEQHYKMFDISRPSRLSHCQKQSKYQNQNSDVKNKQTGRFDEMGDNSWDLDLPEVDSTSSESSTKQCNCGEVCMCEMINNFIQANKKTNENSTCDCLPTELCVNCKHRKYVPPITECLCQYPLCPPTNNCQDKKKKPCPCTLDRKAECTCVDKFVEKRDLCRCAIDRFAKCICKARYKPPIITQPGECPCTLDRDAECICNICKCSTNFICGNSCIGKHLKTKCDCSPTCQCENCVNKQSIFVTQKTFPYDYVPTCPCDICPAKLTGQENEDCKCKFPCQICKTCKSNKEDEKQMVCECTPTCTCETCLPKIKEKEEKEDNEICECTPDCKCNSCRKRRISSAICTCTATCLCEFCKKKIEKTGKIEEKLPHKNIFCKCTPDCTCESCYYKNYYEKYYSNLYKTTCTCSPENKCTNCKKFENLKYREIDFIEKPPPEPQCECTPTCQCTKCRLKAKVICSCPLECKCENCKGVRLDGDTKKIICSCTPSCQCENCKGTKETKTCKRLCKCTPKCVCENCKNLKESKIVCKCTPSCTCDFCLIKTEEKTTETGDSKKMECKCSPECKCENCIAKCVEAANNAKNSKTFICSCSPCCKCEDCPAKRADVGDFKDNVKPYECKCISPCPCDKCLGKKTTKVPTIEPKQQKRTSYEKPLKECQCSPRCKCTFCSLKPENQSSKESKRESLRSIQDSKSKKDSKSSIKKKIKRDSSNNKQSRDKNLSDGKQSGKKIKCICSTCECMYCTCEIFRKKDDAKDNNRKDDSGKDDNRKGPVCASKRSKQREEKSCACVGECNCTNKRKDNENNQTGNSKTCNLARNNNYNNFNYQNKQLDDLDDENTYYENYDKQLKIDDNIIDTKSCKSLILKYKSLSMIPKTQQSLSEYTLTELRKNLPFSEGLLKQYPSLNLKYSKCKRDLLQIDTNMAHKMRLEKHNSKCNCFVCTALSLLHPKDCHCVLCVSKKLNKHSSDCNCQTCRITKKVMKGKDLIFGNLEDTINVFVDYEAEEMGSYLNNTLLNKSKTEYNVNIKIILDYPTVQQKTIVLPHNKPTENNLIKLPQIYNNPLAGVMTQLILNDVISILTKYNFTIYEEDLYEEINEFTQLTFRMFFQRYGVKQKNRINVVCSENEMNLQKIISKIDSKHSIHVFNKNHIENIQRNVSINILKIVDTEDDVTIPISLKIIPISVVSSVSSLKNIILTSPSFEDAKKYVKKSFAECARLHDDIENLRYEPLLTSIIPEEDNITIYKDNEFRDNDSECFISIKSYGGEDIKIIPGQKLLIDKSITKESTGKTDIDLNLEQILTSIKSSIESLISKSNDLEESNSVYYIPDSFANQLEPPEEIEQDDIKSNESNNMIRYEAESEPIKSEFTSQTIETEFTDQVGYPRIWEWKMGIEFESTQPNESVKSEIKSEKLDIQPDYDADSIYYINPDTSPKTSDTDSVHYINTDSNEDTDSELTTKEDKNSESDSVHYIDTGFREDQETNLEVIKEDINVKYNEVEKVKEYTEKCTQINYVPEESKSIEDTGITKVSPSTSMKSEDKIDVLVVSGDNNIETVRQSNESAIISIKKSYEDVKSYVKETYQEYLKANSEKLHLLKDECTNTEQINNINSFKDQPINLETLPSNIEELSIKLEVLSTRKSLESQEENIELNRKIDRNEMNSYLSSDSTNQQRYNIENMGSQCSSSKHSERLEVNDQEITRNSIKSKHKSQLSTDNLDKSHTDTDKEIKEKSIETSIEIKETISAKSSLEKISQNAKSYLETIPRTVRSALEKIPESARCYLWKSQEGELNLEETPEVEKINLELFSDSSKETTDYETCDDDDLKIGIESECGTARENEFYTSREVCTARDSEFYTSREPLSDIEPEVEETTVTKSVSTTSSLYDQPKYNTDINICIKPKIPNVTESHQVDIEIETKKMVSQVCSEPTQWKQYYSPPIKEINDKNAFYKNSFINNEQLNDMKYVYNTSDLVQKKCQCDDNSFYNDYVTKDQKSTAVDELKTIAKHPSVSSISKRSSVEIPYYSSKSLSCSSLTKIPSVHNPVLDMMEKHNYLFEPGVLKNSLLSERKSYIKQTPKPYSSKFNESFIPTSMKTDFSIRNMGKKCSTCSSINRDPVLSAKLACEAELEPIKEALNTVQTKLRNLNMPELDCILCRSNDNLSFNPTSLSYLYPQNNDIGMSSNFMYRNRSNIYKNNYFNNSYNDYVPTRNYFMDNASNIPNINPERQPTLIYNQDNLMPLYKKNFSGKYRRYQYNTDYFNEHTYPYPRTSNYSTKTRSTIHQTNCRHSHYRYETDSVRSKLSTQQSFYQHGVNGSNRRHNYAEWDDIFGNDPTRHSTSNHNKSMTSIPSRCYLDTGSSSTLNESTSEDEAAQLSKPHVKPSSRRSSEIFSENDEIKSKPTSDSSHQSNYYPFLEVMKTIVAKEKTRRNRSTKWYDLSGISGFENMSVKVKVKPSKIPKRKFRK